MHSILILRLFLKLNFPPTKTIGLIGIITMASLARDVLCLVIPLMPIVGSVSEATLRGSSPQAIDYCNDREPGSATVDFDWDFLFKSLFCRHSSNNINALNARLERPCEPKIMAAQTCPSSLFQACHVGDNSFGAPLALQWMIRFNSATLQKGDSSSASQALITICRRGTALMIFRGEWAVWRHNSGIN